MSESYTNKIIPTFLSFNATVHYPKKNNDEVIIFSFGQFHIDYFVWYYRLKAESTIIIKNGQNFYLLSPFFSKQDFSREHGLSRYLQSSSLTFHPSSRLLPIVDTNRLITCYSYILMISLVGRGEEIWKYL